MYVKVDTLKFYLFLHHFLVKMRNIKYIKINFILYYICKII